MDIQPKLCSQTTIEQFLTDHLSQAELDAFESHLEDCPQCRARLENMAAEGAWWVEARGYLSSGTSLPEGSSGVLASAHAGEDLSEETAIGLYGIKNYLAPTDDPRMLGRLGGYEIMGVVGCGGMGVVLKAFEPPLNRYVAIKVLGPQLALSGAARQRFTREAKAAAAVVHDNVIAIHTIGDPIIPIWQELLYFAKLDPFGHTQFTPVPTPEYGHCTFTTSPDRHDVIVSDNPLLAFEPA